MDKDWRYVEVPRTQNVNAAVNRLLMTDGALLAPWDYCGRGSIRKDDVLAEVSKKLQDGECKLSSRFLYNTLLQYYTTTQYYTVLIGKYCHWNYHHFFKSDIYILTSGSAGDELHHLAWDVSVVLDDFLSLSREGDDIVSSFLMTDGGLTLFSEQNDVSGVGGGRRRANPYNSTLYRMAAAARRPRIHVERFVSDRIGEEIQRKQQQKNKAFQSQASQTTSDAEKDDKVAEEEKEEEDLETRLFFQVCRSRCCRCWCCSCCCCFYCR